MYRLADLPPLLTAEDESRLARQIEAGVLASDALATGALPFGATADELADLEAEGRRAWQLFLLSNLRLVLSLMRPALGRSSTDPDELFQEGVLALTRALQRFDHTRGRFSTYAAPVVKRHLMEVTSSRAGALNIPARRAVQLRHAQAVADSLLQERGRVVELTELADALGSSVEWTRRLLEHRASVSLEAVTAADWLAQPEPGDLEDELDAARIAEDLALLPGYEREALRLRFGFDDGQCHSYREIALRLGISPSSARRSVERALSTLRARHVPALASEAS